MPRLHGRATARASPLCATTCNYFIARESPRVNANGASTALQVSDALLRPFFGDAGRVCVPVAEFVCRQVDSAVAHSRIVHRCNYL